MVDRIFSHGFYLMVINFDALPLFVSDVTVSLSCQFPVDNSEVGMSKPWHVSEFARGWMPASFVMVRPDWVSSSVHFPVFVTSSIRLRTCKVAPF